MTEKKDRKRQAQKKAPQGPLVVVPLPPVGPWNFHERLDRDSGVISRWIESSHWAIKTRAHFDRALDQLRCLPMQRWSKPNPASKIGDHTYVIRFKDSSSQQLRVFGHFFRAHHAFAMTLDGYEKDDVYHPNDYENLAQEHRAFCDKDFVRRTGPFESLCASCNGESVC
ncbi:hypothetical protein [Hydrogenophaga sp. BPS33]|uniref:hypothetical protein n=1 Tax=Hydrogenophaga sp. BPS33 TaxID=2651974 RepID=UPI001F1F40C8|nr:hypothetical protein [Hydrogenophaga sp. BPS33]